MTTPISTEEAREYLRFYNNAGEGGRLWRRILAACEERDAAIAERDRLREANAKLVAALLDRCKKPLAYPDPDWELIDATPDDCFYAGDKLGERRLARDVKNILDEYAAERQLAHAEHG